MHSFGLTHLQTPAFPPVSCHCHHCRGLMSGAASLLLMAALSDCAYRGMAGGGWEQVYLEQPNRNFAPICFNGDSPSGC